MSGFYANMSHQSMIPDVAEGGSASPQTQEPQYDQFLISCSDDGSVNVYDVSSFSKDSKDEFYKKGKLSPNIYKAYSKALCKVNENEDPLMVMKNLLDQSVQSQEITIIENESNDKITRRTRKRMLASSGGTGGNTN